MNSGTYSALLSEVIDKARSDGEARARLTTAARMLSEAVNLSINLESSPVKVSRGEFADGKYHFLLQVPFKGLGRVLFTAEVPFQAWLENDGIVFDCHGDWRTVASHNADDVRSYQEAAELIDKPLRDEVTRFTTAPVSGA